MSVPPYPRYKPSGVEWLGDIPEHWDIAKFRHHFRESSEKIEDNVVGPMLSVSGYRGIEIKEYDDENRRRLVEDLVGYRIVRPGQLVVNTMWLNYAGLGVSEYEGHVSPAYRSYWIDVSFDRRFIHYLMRSYIYVKGYTKYLTGIRPNSLQMSRDDLMDFPVLLPPSSTQSEIVVFLDRETAKIDALVEEQKRLIDLLKIKRQTLITQVVTKGLDPTAPTKPSGIECLGALPVHWEVLPLKHMVSHVVDCLHTTPHYDGEPLYPAIRTADVERGVLLLDQARLVCEEVYQERIQRLKPEPDDILYSREGERFGMAALVPDGVDLCLGQRMMMFRASKENDPQYLMWFLNSDAIYNQVLAGLAGATSPHINIGEINNYAVARPPKVEQVDIARYVTREVVRVDDLLAEADKAIALLNEHRSALISAVVTGKIDVRGLAPASKVEKRDRQLMGMNA